jgi:hypothetical protein
MRLSVTVDFPDDITKGLFDLKRLDAVMAVIESVGASRLHWMYYGEVTADDPRRGNIWNCRWATHGPESIAILGEPLQAAVRAARRRNLEVLGVLKPYNGGLSGSYPMGSPEAGSTSQLTRIGGTLQQVIPFLEEHPEMRLERKPTTHVKSNGGPIREIRLAKEDAGETRLRPDHLRIWVSADNFRYRPLDTVPRGVVRIESAARDVRDYHGNLLTRKGDPVRVLRLTDLAIEDPYVVLTTTFADGAGDFRNTPLGMVETIGDDGQPLECILATHAALWIKPRDFRTYGLEFDMGYGHLPVALDEPWTATQGDLWTHFAGEDEFEGEAIFGHGEAGGFVGIARGKNQFLPAAPCEAYPEIRALWLGWVRAMLDAGVDGVDLRISAHGCLSDEPEAYGWNPPVLAAYNERFGPGPGDPAGIAAVRGDFYTEFLREASALVRARGKKLQVHLHAEAFRPKPVFGQQHGIPSNIEFQWRRWLEEELVDEVYLRTSWFEAAEDPLGAETTTRSRLTRALADPVVEEMLAVAARKNLPVTLNRYIGRAARLAEYLDDITLALRDGRFAGFDVYEHFDIAQADATKAGLTERQGRVSGLRARWRDLKAEKEERSDSRNSPESGATGSGHG